MTSWSESRITALRAFWLDGLSASQISKALGGVTRNAVIGKIHRLGLSGRGACAAPSRAAHVTALRPACPRRAPGRRAPVAQPVTIVLAAPSPAPEASGLITDMARLGVHACKWPIGDPKSADFSFCGRHAGGRYCLAHEAQSVRPGAAWRADQDPVVRRALAGLI